MTMFIEPGLYLRPQPLTNGPRPDPLEHGFSAERAYRVLGGFTMSESAEMYLMLCNDAAELWFISNRHFRVHAVHPELTQLSYFLKEET